MSTYQKTAQGQQEIIDRAGGLGLRARRLLILVDGQRDAAELGRLSGDTQVEDTLHTLAEAGFIQPASASASTAAGSPSAGATPPEGTRTAQGAAREPSLTLAQDFMMNTLRTFHGPYGKLDLVKRIHASRQATELRALFDEWLQSISESRIGRKRADELSARLLEVMPG
ncbi:MAG: hypothetical protein ACYC5W_01955 [Thauera sp.]